MSLRVGLRLYACGATNIACELYRTFLLFQGGMISKHHDIHGKRRLLKTEGLQERFWSCLELR
jgi:hypothetical protein